MKPKEYPGQKIICLNRKASFNYFFLELLEAGISLKGSEVKSIRDGKASIADSYAVETWRAKISQKTGFVQSTKRLDNKSISIGCIQKRSYAASTFQPTT